MKRFDFLWILTLLMCIIGLSGQLSLTVADSKANPAPAFTMPFFWLWSVSPTLAWASASICLRNRLAQFIVLMICASVGSMGGWWFLWRDTRWVPDDERNPFLATSGILMSLTIYPAFHWTFFLVSMLLCFVVSMNWEKHSSPEIAEK
jgi:hypothetical protein